MSFSLADHSGSERAVGVRTQAHVIAARPSTQSACAHARQTHLSSLHQHNPGRFFSLRTPVMTISVEKTPSSPDNGGQKDQLVTQINEASNPRECLSCRIMGTGVMAGTGSYAIWHARAAAPGSPGQKKIIAGLGLGESCG